MTWPPILTLGAVDEGGFFSVEAMKTIRLLVYKRVILGDELPADLRGDDVLVNAAR